MYYLECDYHEGCDEAVLQALIETNRLQTPGYGTDACCEAAREAIRPYLGNFSGEIHFVVGGTQANVLVLEAALAPYQGVLCADSGHIHVHETGALESRGRKCLPIASDGEGRVDPQAVAQALEEHFGDGAEHEHEVMPGMLYLSQATELGTVYTKAQLQTLKAICDPYGVGLFIDGARLGYALADPLSDLRMEDLPSLCDVFTIGGTKQGLLFGEAIVINRPERFPHFRYMMKRSGALLAKGRLLGVQYRAIFEDGRYFTLARRAVDQALQIRSALEAAGFSMLSASRTNQQFVRLPRAVYDALSEDFVFEVQKHTADAVEVRICTSWATEPEEVEKLVQRLEALALRAPEMTP